MGRLRIRLRPYPRGSQFQLPAPTHFTNFIRAQSHIDRGHFAYLLGEWSNDGWWHYFAIVFLVKTPAITLIFLVITIGYLTWRRRWQQTVYLWLPVITLFIAASYSRLNIGYRHILPIIPFIWLLIADTAPFLAKEPHDTGVVTSRASLLCNNWYCTSPKLSGLF